LSTEQAATRYAVAVRSVFDALIGTAAQMSAALLAVTAGLRDTSSAEALVRSACASHAEAVDALRSVRVPSSARHFHRHIEQAAKLIGVGLSATPEARLLRGIDVDRSLAQVRRGWDELNRATAAMPGLSVINLGHCCGAGALRPEPGWLVQR
jgi:hypothetical protein